MYYAVLNGSVDAHSWCRVSWEEHFNLYKLNNSLIIKYEDLKKNAFKEIKKVLEHIDINVSKKHILKSIDNQSFEKKKKEFKKKGQGKKAKFLKTGKVKQWESYLNKDQVNTINKKFEKELRYLGYL